MISFSESAFDQYRNLIYLIRKSTFPLFISTMPLSSRIIPESCEKTFKPSVRKNTIKNTIFFISNFSFFLFFYLFLCYIYSMTYTQTVEIPADRRITLEVPREVPAGKTILTFTPAKTEPSQRRRGFGCAKGQFWMADDFNEPLEDFKDYM